MTADTALSPCTGMLSRGRSCPARSLESPVLAVRTPSLITAFALAAAAPAAFAAHPLQTEDTGTQGAGNLEIENGVSNARLDATTRTVYQPQFSLGLAATLDAILQPAWVWQHAPRGGVSGPGDTNVDAKWRFWGSDPLSLAIRAGIELATAERGLGLPRGKAAGHALLALTWDHAATTLHADLGATVAPRVAGAPARRTTVNVSGALMQQVDEGLILTLDGAFGQSPDPRRDGWPGTLLAGAIWTARPGLDLDFGWQRSIDDRPVTRTWLAGLTYRFAL